MDKLKRHKELCDEIHEVYEAKNMAYGDSFGRCFNEFGLLSAIVRMWDKWNRITNLAKHPDIDTKDEAITDTLLDLSNYCLMTVMELEKKNGDN